MYLGEKAKEKRKSYLGERIPVQIYLDPDLRHYLKYVAASNGIKFHYFAQEMILAGLKDLEKKIEEVEEFNIEKDLFRNTKI